MSDSAIEAPAAGSGAWSATTRRTFRFWGVALVIYALLIGASVAAFVPWKTPWVNVALIGYAGLHLVAAVGLLQLRRWGWRLALGGAWLGLIAMVIVASGLVMSWAYLRTVYGDFGLGASIGALIFCSLVLQVLGLIPGLLLRALLRREVRADLGAGERGVRVALGLLAVPFVLGLLVQVLYGISPPPPVSADGQAQSIAHLRAALLGEARPEMPALRGVPVGAAPVFVTLYRGGKVAARVRGEGADLAEAIGHAADALAGHSRIKGRKVADGRLKVDRVIGVAPVLSTAAPVVALSVNPGVDGLRRIDPEAERVLLPDDLVKKQRFGVAPLVPGIREMRLGLAAGAVLTRLGLVHGDLERVRTEGWVEFEGRALPVFRGNTPAPPEGPDSWRQAAIEGGDFVLRQIRKDGSFHYQYYPLDNRHPRFNMGNYSLPRHAGTVYALALLHGLTGMPRFKAGAERAIAWLDTRMPKSCGAPDRTCVVKGKIADLGSAALSMVGMLEYQRRTKDARYEETIRRLGRFILAMQRPDGDFHHIWKVPEAQIDPGPRKMFYSEEASLALIMAHEVLGDDEWLAAAERALDFLTGPKYEGYFLGHFIYGADHWTCIAAEEAWPRLKNPQYLDFCLGYSRFIERTQYSPGWWDNHDFAGHYGFSALLIPQAPAAAGFTEAIVSTWELSKHHGRPAADMEVQMALGLDALAREQVRAENSYLMPDPAAARGGIRRSLVEQEVRIDFTQHSVAALIRGAVAAEAR